ncbi:MAG: TatD family hydrolase [Candidatus Nanoarchaeia archaeon]|jgi:TatD DNase family protein|nr:TatD family hydrolase [Candidatus Nanoarchaeia archaeon]|tara:strand:- start:21976 stop:22731 length:756 start_codon:yes stop_codon:yes gene_type:complete
MMLVDIHAHIFKEYFDKDISKVVERAKKNNFVSIINAGINSKTNKEVLDLSKKFPILKPSLGLYPLEGLRLDEDEIEKDLNFIIKNKNKIICVGEVGLDYYYIKNKNKEQKIIFQKIIDLTEKIKLPIVVHSRKAELDCIEMLESSKIKKIIMHSFTGSMKIVNRIQNNGWTFSIPTSITYSTQFQNIVDKTSISQILTETDSPYLSPIKNKRNEPSNIIFTIEKISEIKKLEKNEIEKLIFMNFQKIFVK